MDKFADAFKATVAVFHGIIATWLFLEFSDTKVTEFYFVILLVFFTVANLYVWRILLIVPRALHKRFASASPEHEAALASGQSPLYRPTDVFGLTIVAVAVGLFAAYLQNEQVVLRAANMVSDWHRTDTDAPLQLLLKHVSTHTMQVLDAREPALAQKSGGGAYLRVFMKDLKFAYEGYPGWVPGKLDEPQIILTPACRLSLDPNDASKVVSGRAIEGPGVYLNLTQALAVEIIDISHSACGKSS